MVHVCRCVLPCLIEPCLYNNPPPPILASKALALVKRLTNAFGSAHRSPGFFSCVAPPWPSPSCPPNWHSGQDADSSSHRLLLVVIGCLGKLKFKQVLNHDTFYGLKMLLWCWVSFCTWYLYFVRNYCELHWEVVLDKYNCSRIINRFDPTLACLFTGSCRSWQMLDCPGCSPGAVGVFTLRHFALRPGTLTFLLRPVTHRQW